MKPLSSWIRVAEKKRRFSDKFGYNPTAPREIIFGPQEQSDYYENLLDKSLSENFDYLEIEYGWNADQIRERIEKEKYIFYDC
ncbi:peptidase [Streptococcus suis]|uniref:peptidase n=1 Tax=Streptococcus suis TaxID=1307 RepID=UPI000CF59AE6|nr:peptidase [Streptococcus suis]